MKTIGGHKALSLLAVAAVFVVGSASARGAADEGAEFFEKKIRPLLSERCYKCHSAEAQTVKANFRLDGKAALLRGGDSGPVIVPGDVEKSLLIKAVRYKEDKLKMPPDGRLSDAQIADLEQWVKMGAPDPRGAGAPLPKEPGTGINLAQGRKWWAFQPVKDPPAPAVKRADWARTPLDRFILAKLEEKGFSPAPAADKRTLIRRAYHDLIGLPPKPAEVEAFVADESPEAFAKVVDHLLARPQYGERWGRHWLDVVRYTDSFDARITGNELDSAFAWRYRDWVVNAFNEELPYDQFVKHQVAGDLLPPPAPGAINKKGLIATGVYMIGEWGGGDSDKDKLITDIVDDQVDLTSRAFLGMTVSCARCHDHKFDPISIEDYYGLAGIFFSTHVLPNPGPKTNGPNTIRIPLMDKPEVEKRQADEARIAELAALTDKLLDEHYVKQAAEMLPRVGEYLTAAWEYKNFPNDAKPPLAGFASGRNLNSYALTQWLNYVGVPSLKLFPQAVKDVNGVKGIDAWQNPDAAGTPIVVANKTDKPLTLLPSLVIPPTSINMHPSPTAGVAVAWRSPFAAKVRITGKVTDGHNVCGDGIAWSISRFGGSGAGELASGTIANGGTQNFKDGTGGSQLESIEVNEGEMLQLAILPKADHSCDTTNVELEITEIGGAGDTWNLVKDCASTLTRGNPHADSYANRKVWHFHDMAGQAQAVFAAGSAMSKFTASVTAAAGTDGGAVRAAADEVRKALEAAGAESAALKAAGKDAATIATPDASFYQTLTAPRGTFWAAARADESSLPKESRDLLAAMKKESEEIRKTLALAIPYAHAMQEGGTPSSMFPGIQDVPVHLRGSYGKLGEIVPRRFPQVIAGEKQPPITSGSGRKELADWLASPTNPLTARVMANRIWQGHFGEGIVRTANNFGKLGTPPTHPELLDHLATRLVQLNWSMKAFHRELMLSATYRQASEGDAATEKSDPDNLLFGRMNRRRLDAEGLRDSLLAVTERLNPERGGPAINDLNTPRRTLYVMTIRSDRANYRTLFDAADAGAIVEKRVDSTVAPQALFLLNNSFALDQTKALARRAIVEGGETDAGKIDWLYRLLFARPATAKEVEIGTAALADARTPRDGEAMTPELPWEAYCQVLLCSNEFMYVD